MIGQDLISTPSEFGSSEIGRTADYNVSVDFYAILLAYFDSLQSNPAGRTKLLPAMKQLIWSPGDKRYPNDALRCLIPMARLLQCDFGWCEPPSSEVDTKEITLTVAHAMRSMTLQSLSFGDEFTSYSHRITTCLS
ncbi:hypothetical protein FRB94_009933 [Tulasnella sp. JGI-2019a]|nr:hypothetical protein FRB94_009933 [Tulasnella sp. JGI-2019a]